MKSILFTAALAASLTANAASVNFGYCSGQTGSLSWRANSENEWIEAAIYIPASTLNTYAGATIKAIRGVLTSGDRTAKIKVWLKSDINGEKITEKSQSPSMIRPMVKGWNEVKLPSGGYVIPADNTEGLYVGFSALSNDEGYMLNAVDASTTGGYWINTQAFGWRDNGYGSTVCIEAVIEGDNLPGTNLKLLNPEPQPPYVVSRGKMDVAGELMNLGTEAIDGYDLVARLNGKEVARQHINEPIQPMQRVNYSVNYTPEISAVGPHELTVEAVPESDADLTDNATTCPMDVVADEYPHTVLLEEFTTEWCGNCPPVSEMVHSVLATEPYKGNVILVCHHSGYKTDWLTTTWDEELLDLYGGGSFAPGLSLDRYMFSSRDRSVVWFTGEDEQDIFTGRIDLRLNWPAVVTFDLKASLNGDVIAVNLTGEKCVETLCDNPVVTVYLVEDGITAENQAGADGVYIHDGVTRATNSTWGDPIAFDGDQFAYSCSLDIPAEVNRENMRVVAFLSDNNAHFRKRTVMNAAQTADFSTTGISNVTEDAQGGEAVYFNLQGQRVANPEQGIFVKVANGHAEKVKI